MLGDMILIKDRILQQLLQPTLRCASFINQGRCLIARKSANLKKLTLPKDTIDYAKTFKSANFYGPIDVFRVRLQTWVVQEVAELKMSLFGGAEILHLVDQFDNVVLIGLQFFGIIQQFKINLLLDMIINGIQILHILLPWLPLHPNSIAIKFIDRLLHAPYRRCQETIVKHGLNKGISIMPLTLKDQVPEEALFLAVFEQRGL